MKVTHKFKSDLPDTSDKKRMQPSDWNADHDIEGLGTLASQNSDSVDITGGKISGITPLAVEYGGTGANNPAKLRENLGMGTLATQQANAVNITGGSVSGITDISISDGGTGASNSADARRNLNIYSKTEVDLMIKQLSDRIALLEGANNV